MKILSKMFFRGNFFLIFVFILALIPRVYRLDKFPVAMIHDELNYVMNAKSIFLTGKNIPLTASALLSWGNQDFDVVISELPSVLISPWIGLVSLNQFNARIPYALISSLSVVLIYLIARLLLGESVAKYTGIVAAASPWSIHIGRTALEVNFALFFFLVGVYLFIKHKSWGIFYSLPAFIAMFFSYLGAKLHFFPLILIFLIFKYFQVKNGKKDIKKYILYGFACFSVLAFYSLTIQKQPSGERTDELIFFERDWTASLVNNERRQSIPNSGLEIFSNKATVILRRIADVYLKAFSTIGLFSRGETVSVYSTWEYGQFHYLDFFLIIIGIAVLFSLNKKVFWLFFATIILAPWVSAIDLVEETYAIRAYPMFPFLWVLSGLGFWYIKEKLKFGKLLVVFLGVVYVASFAYFMNLYIYRYPIYSAERWFFSERLFTSYIMRSMKNPSIDKIYVSTIESPKIVFENYLFYSSLYNTKQEVVKANSIIKSKDFTYDKLTIVHGCPKNIKISENDLFIADRRFGCLEEVSQRRGIVDLKDAGTVYIIGNDKLCSDMSLQRYYRPMNFEVFEIEKMSNEEFCKNWIISF